MSWAEKMKEVIGQGIDASAELASRAGDLASELGTKAAELGRETATKARDLSERGAAAIELKKMQLQFEKVINKLGFETYFWLVEKKASSISTVIPEIKAILDEIETLRGSMEEKEAAMKAAGKNGEN